MTADQAPAANVQALSGPQVLDFRILAGPNATQLLADLGAEVIKIERPETGDDTRGWGLPFQRDTTAGDGGTSAYCLAANRGRHSDAANMADPRGQALLKALVRESDTLIENFKPGDLERYGLDNAALSATNPGLIYCSITGFGQTGPKAHRKRYDLLVQAEGELMSLTGTTDGPPMKTGVGNAELMCGLYTVAGILAAMQARHMSGRGKHIDIALLDTQVAMLINQGVAHLMDGQLRPGAVVATGATSPTPRACRLRPERQRRAAPLPSSRRILRAAGTTTFF